MVPHYSIADPLGLSPEQLLSYPTASHAHLWCCAAFRLQLACCMTLTLETHRGLIIVAPQSVPKWPNPRDPSISGHLLAADMTC